MVLSWDLAVEKVTDFMQLFWWSENEDSGLV